MAEKLDLIGYVTGVVEYRSTLRGFQEEAKFTNEVQHRYKPESHFVCEFSGPGRG